jgi:hypothetical protein
VFDPRTSVPASFCAVLCLILTACGGSGGDGTPPPTGPAQVSGTLAYVETECRGTAQGFFEHQALRIRQGDREPVTVFETPEVSVPGSGFLCPALMGGRFGPSSVAREAFQSVTVSHDGASVAFDVSDDFSVNPHLPLNLPPEQKGIFWVRADGTGLRRLGPPSREPFFSVDHGFTEGQLGLSFSPNGGTIVFADRGLDADGHEATQVVTIDVATGTRTQVTHLPPAVPPAGYPGDAPTVINPLFIDNQTIRFKASANPNGVNPKCANLNGANPECSFLLMTIKTDGSDLEVPLPIVIPLPGSQVVELQFVITGDQPLDTNVVVPGEPTNNPPLGGVRDISEIFVIDQAKNALQLTSFRRVDTLAGPVDVDQDHVYFIASANPLGTNSSLNCQLFSIDRLGSNLRQLTNFRETDYSVAGCDFYPRPKGCGMSLDLRSQDPRSRTLLFYSDCDPLGTNPNGGQIFAMRSDGSGLRQLTDAQGLVKEAPGAFSGDIPGLWAYGPDALL